MEPQRTEIFHREFNLDNRDNLISLPARPAVYGLFAIIDGQPVNCRYVGLCSSLQAEVRAHFEQEASVGLRTFMQGPWIKMLLYRTLSSESSQDAATEMAEWMRQYDPHCEDDGEYRSGSMEVTV